MMKQKQVTCAFLHQNADFELTERQVDETGYVKCQTY